MQYSKSQTKNTVYIYLSEIDKIREPKLLAQYKSILDDYELQRMQCLRKKEHQHQFLISHALLRYALSEHHNISAENWVFAKGPHGKPFISNPLQNKKLYFNLSHSNDIAVCAISCENNAGIDIENNARTTNIEKIAQRYFHSSEIAELKSLSAKQKTARFIEYWTLKEAYAKAQGTGLTMELKNCAFHLEANQKLNFMQYPKNFAAKKNWFFSTLDWNKNHTISVCIENPSLASIELVIHKTRALQKFEKISLPIKHSSE